MKFCIATSLLCFLLIGCSVQGQTTRGTEDYRSCWNNCGLQFFSCSCRDDCRYYGNCCPDYIYNCAQTTAEAHTSATLADSCGGMLSGSSGSFSSPHYPNYYPPNAYCEWQIRVPQGQRVTLAFTSLQLEVTCCGCDHVSVYDGPSTGYTLIAKLCQSNSTGRPIYSSSSYLTVVFRSDGSVSNTGFNAVYNTGQETCRYNCGYRHQNCSCSSSCQYYGDCCPDYCDYCSHYSQGYCAVPTSSPVTGPPPCGGQLHGSGSFSSPYYPGSYPNNANCMWRLVANSGQRISLDFNDIQLENCCTCDFIAVYDGPSTSYPLLGKICYNSTVEIFHSSSSQLTVVFRTDSSGVRQGFRAQFTSSLPTSSGRVDCSSDNMLIVIQTSYLNSIGYSGYDLYLNDEFCRPQVSYYQVVFSFPVNTCGTTQQLSNGRITYTNDIRAYRSSSGEITRQSNFHLHVGCRMQQDTTVQIMYKAWETNNGSLTGSGSFNATIAFYTSSSFQYKVYDVPYVVNPNQYLYVQVQLTTNDSSLVLFLDTCVASPSPHDFSTRSYDLVRNGCARDGTYYAYSSGYATKVRFRFQAFKFLRAHPSVYLQCKVAVCPARVSGTRCTQGCRTRKARTLGAVGDSATVVLGPIQLDNLHKGEGELPLVDAFSEDTDSSQGLAKILEDAKLFPNDAKGENGLGEDLKASEEM